MMSVDIWHHKWRHQSLHVVVVQFEIGQEV